MCARVGEGAEKIFWLGVLFPPTALDPFPEATSPCQGNKQKSVKHRATDSTSLQILLFHFLVNHPFLVKQVLSDGWVPGQAGFTFLPYWGGGEDAQALEGSKRAGWYLKIKTCKFLSCPPAWATLAFFAPYLRVPHISGLEQAKDVTEGQHSCAHKSNPVSCPSVASVCLLQSPRHVQQEPLCCHRMKKS